MEFLTYEFDRLRTPRTSADLQLSCSDMQTTLTLTPEPSAPETAPELYLIMEEEKLNVCGFARLGATLTGGRRAADWFRALSEHGASSQGGS
jgi:hypothetical protein